MPSPLPLPASEPPPPCRRWLWGLLLLLVVALGSGLGSGLKLGQGPAAPSAPAVPLRAVRPASAVFAAAPAPAALAVAPLRVPAASGAATASLSLCGFGNLDPSDRAGEVWQRFVQRYQDAWRLVVAQAEDSPDDDVRAAALLAAWSMGLSGPEALIALSRQASTTTSPYVYALAMTVCVKANLGEAAAVCQPLSAEQWARVDPDNAYPSLELAWRAMERGDTVQVTEALHRAATSQKIDSYLGRLAPTLLAPLASRVPLAVRGTMTQDLIGIEAAFAMPALQVVSKGCDAAALQDVNRRQTCSALAELLFDRSDTMLFSGLGYRLGRRLGWSEERLQQVDRDQQELQARVLDFPEGAPGMSCSRTGKLLRWSREVARLGEIGALRLHRRP